MAHPATSPTTSVTNIISRIEKRNIGGLLWRAFYHQRSNIESTFSMVKAKFGDSVRSKTDTAMGNEVLAIIVCHNVCCLISAMYELGITPEFAQAV
jgi:hypothetical protein